MSSTLDPAALQLLQESGDQLLLPSAHAAALWRKRLCTDVHPGVQTRSPLAWQEWTASQWARGLVEGQDDRILLNRAQEEQLWSELIANSPESSKLSAHAVYDLATLARSALQKAAAYRIVHRLRAEADSEDAETFALWAEKFLQRCEQQRLLPQALLEDALASHIGLGQMIPAAGLHCVGWEQTSPAQQHLLEALTGAGVEVAMHSLVAAENGESKRLGCLLASGRDELRTAVRLLRQQAESAEVAPAGLAILTTDPHDRPVLERLFRELLAPELDQVSADLSSTPWHFGHGTPLSLVPLIADALDALRWCLDPLPIHRIEQLFLSPFFRYADPFEQRARVDLADWKDNRQPHASLELAALRALLPLRSRARGERDAVRLQEWSGFGRAAERLDLQRTRLPHAEWSDKVRELLSLVGWPGERALCATEFRAVEAWEKTLDLLATLQFQGKRVGFAEWLSSLLRETHTVNFVDTLEDAAIQVLTPEQAEGLPFELVVHLGASDRKLPAREAKHPLLPYTLQRSCGIGEPGPTLQHGADRLRSLAARSRKLVLLASGDETGDSEPNLTPLAQSLAFHEVPPGELLPPEATPASPPLEPVPEEASPAFTLSAAPGGADLLQKQAACAFSAFATYRLGARDRSTRALGLDHREIGNLLHAAMENFWRTLHTQAELKRLPHDERDTRLRQAILTAFERFRRPGVPLSSWDERYFLVLEKRFHRLLRAWCDCELKRLPFTVLDQETKKELELGPLRLKVRLDRVDQVEGGLVLVDYKTSSALNCDHWLGERPDLPQLPAYASLSFDEPVRGIAFGRIRPGEMNWISLADDPALFPGRDSKTRRVADLGEHIDDWKQELTRLAVAFAAGESGVQPKSHPDTCTFCRLRPLCRFDAALEATDDALSVQPEDHDG